MILQTKHLDFTIGEDAGGARFIPHDNKDGGAVGSDFWRLILDNGARTEIPVYSHMQKGKATMCGDVLTVEYNGLVSGGGEHFDIDFTVTVTSRDGLFEFVPSLRNRTADVRVNECFCPLCDFVSLIGNKEDDKIYMPHGLGTKINNPWKFLESLTTNYYSHDDKEVFWHQHYPRASMGWFGVESGDRFLYVAKYDEKMRHCFMTARHKIHSEPSNMILGIDNFPMARPGESLTMATSVVGLLEGDWRAAADKYRGWADRTFFKVTEKADWVKNLTGWQRVILRAQSGEDYYTAKDLPDIYRAGAAHGIHTLFIFAWWKEGMDRNYPIYNEPYPGAFAELRDAIREVRALGGRVILECNCHFLDPSTSYYKEHADEVKIIDINGNEVRPAFVYAEQGEFRVSYGARQFPLCCSGTERWREQVLSQLRLMNEIDADCLFADCYGGTPYQPCFNDRHEHGARVDEEWVGHRKFFDSAVAFCKEENKVFAAEVVTDIAAAYTQFLHGLVNVDFKIKSDAFPQLFRYTFPEVVTTDRGIRDEEGDFAKRLKHALVFGVRYDAELYVCRADLSRAPKYAAVVGYCTEKLNEYKDFFFDGKYTVIDTGELPYYIKRGEYYSADGSKILRVLYNASDADATACGVALAADEMKFEIFNAIEYNKTRGI